MLKSILLAKIPNPKNLSQKKVSQKKPPSQKEILLKFNEGTNVIVGPKGGGKSTLFNLVAGIEQKYIARSTKQALESMNLKFIEATLNSGEKISYKNMKDVKKKLEVLYENRYDVIHQDDEIKKNIHNTKKVEKAKKEYVKRALAKSMGIINLVKKVENLHKNSNDLRISMNRSDINWTNTFDIKQKSKSKYEIIYKPSYNSSSLLSEISLWEKKLINYLNKIKDHKQYLENLLHLFDKRKPYESVDFASELKKQIKQNTQNIEVLINIFDKEIKFQKKHQVVLSAFQQAYDKAINHLKKSKEKNETIEQYVLATTNYFATIAKKIAWWRKVFNEFVGKKIFLQIDCEREKDGMLEYGIKDDIENSQIGLNKDNMFEILGVVLYKPDSPNDLSKWLLRVNEKGIKEFDSTKVIASISKILEKKDNGNGIFRVYANNKDYETMSLGERSVFGIRYKFKNSSSENLFLDQIEDNIDNHTIASYIIGLINSKKGQKFIVTHNANVGVLSGVNNVIIADKDVKNNPSNDVYFHGKIVSDFNQNDEQEDLAYYLEGGIKTLKTRYKIITGESQNDIKN